MALLFVFKLSCYFAPLLTLIIFLNPYANGEDIIKQENGCNLFQGSWVFDNTYPLYDASNCPFVSSDWNCHARPGKDYLKYRWKPDGCDLPSFNGVDFLQRFRGKKIMFVGDSLSNNQWQSLTCMLHTAVPNSKYTSSKRGQLSTFSLPEYGILIMRFTITTHFFVDLVTENVGRVLKLNSISAGNQWLGVDILIFNSYHWWLHQGKLQPWDYLQVGNTLSKDMDRMAAYKIGLTTWAKWVDSNINPLKTRVFFQGISATHYHGIDWNEPKVNNCRGQTKPIGGSNYPGNHYPREAVLKSVLGSMKKPVSLLDIALLTQLRKNGHPSQYSSTSFDCSHWCLASVPDSWNQLLYTILTQK
ncbi:Protein trichome birefringence-like 42 [Camellia lanceoleosa]|uniref:Protein trichome birefringence-like 42 n=1 Tax=Camellia lanceoleosa TaxID=1840588 RepID=A0ACC0HFP5_9ERIC|nr:Protein trichome birefringence-like 42 [Camellia lanceoleosa]